MTTAVPHLEELVTWQRVSVGQKCSSLPQRWNLSCLCQVRCASSYQQALKMKNKLKAFVFQNRSWDVFGAAVVRQCGVWLFPTHGRLAMYWFKDIGAAIYTMLPSLQHLTLGCLKYQSWLVWVIPVLKVGLEQLCVSCVMHRCWDCDGKKLWSKWGSWDFSTDSTVCNQRTVELFVAPWVWGLKALAVSHFVNQCTFLLLCHCF